jgi:hypothetical protein
MFPGMAETVEHDVSEATHALAKVIAAAERKNGAWVGGSIFASTPVFEQFQIKKADWETEREGKAVRQIVVRGTRDHHTIVPATRELCRHHMPRLIIS